MMEENKKPSTWDTIIWMLEKLKRKDKNDKSRELLDKAIQISKKINRILSKLYPNGDRVIVDTWQISDIRNINILEVVLRDYRKFFIKRLNGRWWFFAADKVLDLMGRYTLCPACVIDKQCERCRFGRMVGKCWIETSLYQKAYDTLLEWILFKMEDEGFNDYYEVS